jgi:hypothetical protein
MKSHAEGKALSTCLIRHSIHFSSAEGGLRPLTEPIRRAVAGDPAQGLSTLGIESARVIYVGAALLVGGQFIYVLECYRRGFEIHES